MIAGIGKQIGNYYNNYSFEQRMQQMQLQDATNKADL